MNKKKENKNKNTLFFIWSHQPLSFVCTWPYKSDHVYVLFLGIPLSSFYNFNTFFDNSNNFTPKNNISKLDNRLSQKSENFLNPSFYFISHNVLVTSKEPWLRGHRKA